MINTPVRNLGGRPRKPDGERIVNYSTRFNREMMADLDMIIDYRRTIDNANRATIIRGLLATAIKAEKARIQRERASEDAGQDPAP